MSFFRKPFFLMGLALVWTASVGWTLRGQMNRDRSTGPEAALPDRWPAESGLALRRDGPTLVYFAHPLCPCTRNGFDELVEIASRSGGRLGGYIVLVHPPGAPEDWSRSAVPSVPGMTVVRDREAREARRFGARTSGQAALYDARGELRFGGGLTSGRESRGDSAGRQAVRSILRGEAPRFSRTPVFGCALETPTENGGTR